MPIDFSINSKKKNYFINLKTFSPTTFMYFNILCNNKCPTSSQRLGRNHSLRKSSYVAYVLCKICPTLRRSKVEIIHLKSYKFRAIHFLKNYIKTNSGNRFCYHGGGLFQGILGVLICLLFLIVNFVMQEYYFLYFQGITSVPTHVPLLKSIFPGRSYNADKNVN